ncbi:MAG TPA: aminomethyltransferase family protein [Acidimicrobiales bacterium]|jgi:aminomethyltransferase|nr:aminomethyltransferase family protein [Acidimicrobiales bacterium]
MSTEPTESTRSPFYEAAAAMGATFMEEGGWYWTEGFGDIEAEYYAVRDDLGVWDVSPLNKWEFRGPDALAAAQRLHTNNVLGLGVGQVRYGAFCDSEGFMLDDGTVFCLGDRVWVMTNGSDRAEHFAEVTDGLDVEIEGVTSSMPHLGLQGPRSRQALGPLCEADISQLGYFRFIPEITRVGGVPCFVSRTGFGGELGYELFCRPEHALDLWDVVVSKMNARPYGVGVLEALRIEAGLIVLDYDYSAGERTPYDMSLDKMVALGKVDFLGSEALKPVAADPPRRLMTLRVEAEELPEYGADVTRAGDTVGTLTSPATSPRFGLLALAVLDARVAIPGESVEVDCNGTSVPATVAPLAIYDPEKLRPRS